MAEPVKLYKNGEVQTIVAPSVMNDMIADGWSTDEPKVVTVEAFLYGPEGATLEFEGTQEELDELTGGEWSVEPVEPVEPVEAPKPAEKKRGRPPKAKSRP